MERLDVTGYSCPEPVLRTQNFIKEGNTEFEVLVDTNVSKENVARFLEEEGFSVSTKEDGPNFLVIASK